VIGCTGQGLLMSCWWQATEWTAHNGY